LLGIGDLLFPLPTIKAFGGGRYFLTVEDSPYPVTAEHPLSDNDYRTKTFAGLVKFLEFQTYITKADIANHNALIAVHANFSAFWYQYLPKKLDPLACWLDHWGVHLDLTAPWLEADGLLHPVDQPYVCVAIAPRYINEQFDHSILQFCPWPLVYLGLDFEYEWFSTTFGIECEHILADDISHMAAVIANARYFIGAVSSASVLAEGLKVSRVFCSTPRPSNWFTMYGDTAQEVFEHADYIDALEHWGLIE
tara:strand:+ start:1424 stop:2176 length:753 start_codon:yes stop_codon:yes gene_type:complete